ncbi:MAG: hypothetical protein L0229_25875 [Blastocatellia bacterium]|nr:hypothetical protein [Blastocatellia bacterium]
MSVEYGDYEYEYEIEGEVIKLIHGELPAVRWTCEGCGEDSCTIFYDPDEREKLVECETCRASVLVRRGSED